MTIERDVTEFEMTLMDIETSRTVWVGDLKTKGSGSFLWVQKVRRLASLKA
jgi:hypothetical protein